jgi:hypothetical protein
MYVRGLLQAELGKDLGEYLGKTWPRHAVWAAERGQRAFTAAELRALVEVFHLHGVDELFTPPLGVDTVELGGGKPLGYTARDTGSTPATRCVTHSSPSASTLRNSPDIWRTARNSRPRNSRRSPP